MVMGWYMFVCSLILPSINFILTAYTGTKASANMYNSTMYINADVNEKKCVDFKASVYECDPMWNVDFQTSVIRERQRNSSVTFYSCHLYWNKRKQRERKSGPSGRRLISNPFKQYDNIYGAVYEHHIETKALSELTESRTFFLQCVKRRKKRWGKN